MDWVINSMTRAASGIIQPMIINEVTQNLKKSISKFLSDLNREIAKRYYDYHDWNSIGLLQYVYNQILKIINKYNNIPMNSFILQHVIWFMELCVSYEKSNSLQFHSGYFKLHHLHAQFMNCLLQIERPVFYYDFARHPM